jgi:hypothetical protein
MLICWSFFEAQRSQYSGTTPCGIYAEQPSLNPQGSNKTSGLDISLVEDDTNNNLTEKTALYLIQ